MFNRNLGLGKPTSMVGIVTRCRMNLKKTVRKSWLGIEYNDGHKTVNVVAAEILPQAE